MSHAANKWLAIAVDVVAYEMNHTEDGELLSEFCDRLIEKSPLISRALILSVGAALTLHLANILQPKYDLVAKQFWVNALKRMAEI